MGLRTLLLLASLIVVMLFALTASYIAAGTLTSKVCSHMKKSVTAPGSGPQKEGPDWTPSYLVVSYTWLSSGLRVDITVQRPNPCYRVALAGYRASGKTLIVELTAKGPAPGTYCIEVVPPPFKSTVFFTVDKGEYTLLVVVNGKLVKKIPVTP